MNMMQTQRFEWYDTETKVRKHYLLMPNEVDEFHKLIGKGYELTQEYVFARLTGKSMDGKSDLRLVVEYILKKGI